MSDFLIHEKMRASRQNRRAVRICSGFHDWLIVTNSQLRLPPGASDRDRALVSVALGSGLRAGELLSMTCGGIDAGRDVLRVVPKTVSSRSGCRRPPTPSSRSADIY